MLAALSVSQPAKQLLSLHAKMQARSSSELGRIFAVKLLTSSAYLAPEETNSQICQKKKIEIFNFGEKCFDFFYLKCFALLSEISFTIIILKIIMTTK